jgi:hypothetical protein
MCALYDSLAETYLADAVPMVRAATFLLTTTAAIALCVLVWYQSRDVRREDDLKVQ